MIDNSLAELRALVRDPAADPSAVLLRANAVVTMASHLRPTTIRVRSDTAVSFLRCPPRFVPRTLKSDTRGFRRPSDHEPCPAAFR